MALLPVTNVQAVLGEAPPTRTLLQPSDFTYLGYYVVQSAGANTPYSQGLTHRYVNGDFRILTWSYDSVDGRLDELSLAGKTYGQTLAAPVRSWSTIQPVDAGDFYKSIWWDEAKQRLWTACGPDYSTANPPIAVRLRYRTLLDNGTISQLRGPFGLQGVPAKRVYGGVQPVPAWFQQQYGVGPYVAGWGGYTSVMAQGGGAALGGTMYAFNDPASAADGAALPCTVVMDHYTGASGDWYASGSPTTYDRGQRTTRPLNYFDGNSANANPPTNPPTGPWLSPAPDGLGRWTWGDSYFGAGCWIDTPTTHGFVALASLGKGRCWYWNSYLHYDGRQFEWHVYDPAQFGESIQGLRRPWRVQPVAQAEVLLPGMGGMTGGGFPGHVGNVTGLTYDSTTQRLYALGTYVNNGPTNRLYVFQVAA